MRVIKSTCNAQTWDFFIEENYPQSGGFMQTWAWGMFQKSLERPIDRYAVMDGKKNIAMFTLVEFNTRFKLSYGYIPRGPVMLRGIDTEKMASVFETIQEWSKKTFPRFMFLRLEPPIECAPPLKNHGFYIPSFYIQPRYNAVVNLRKSEEEILASFHPSTRANIKKAEKRNVHVVIKDTVTESEYREFTNMIRDTITRNKGVNVYPNDSYFYSLFKNVPFVVFQAFQDNVPSSTHFVLFSGKTATYLYGASHTSNLSSKVDTYLHWAAMKEAKQKGLYYYDLGGIDPERWPGLTTYKRQYRGEELSYIGNIDISYRPFLYRAHSLGKQIKVSTTKYIAKIIKTVQKN